MSANTQSNDGSNADNQNGQTVAVLPTGIAGNPTYITDMEAFVAEIVAELQTIANAEGKPVTEVVVRGSYEIAEALDDYLGADGPDVDNYAMDFRMFLDDEEQDEDGSEAGHATAVREADQDPIVSLVAQHHEMTADEIEEFDPKQREDRELITNEVLSDLETTDDGELDEDGKARINRAKAKSKGKATECLLNDWYDTPTADHVVILEDSTDAYEPAAETVRGKNDWAVYPSECDGIIRNARFSGGDGLLSWTLAMLHNDDSDLEADDLGEEQEARLKENYDADMLERVGVEVEDDGGQAEPSPSTGAMRPDEEGKAVAGATGD
jgi:hypothetical protein